MAEIGFIGLGIMGKPMAGHLLKAGHTVYVYDIVPASVAELKQQGAMRLRFIKRGRREGRHRFSHRAGHAGRRGGAVR